MAVRSAHPGRRRRRSVHREHRRPGCASSRSPDWAARRWASRRTAPSARRCWRCESGPGIACNRYYVRDYPSLVPPAALRATEGRAPDPRGRGRWVHGRSARPLGHGPVSAANRCTIDSTRSIAPGNSPRRSACRHWHGTRTTTSAARAAQTARPSSTSTPSRGTEPGWVERTPATPQPSGQASSAATVRASQCQSPWNTTALARARSCSATTRRWRTGRGFGACPCRPTSPTVLAAGRAAEAARAGSASVARTAAPPVVRPPRQATRQAPCPRRRAPTSSGR